MHNNLQIKFLSYEINIIWWNISAVYREYFFLNLSDLLI